eukprot:PITA_26950
MIEEYRAVIGNNTWKLVDCPQNVKPVGCKWVYRIKYNQKGELEKYKARLVAKGTTRQKTKNFVLGRFSDADFAGSIDDQASTSGYLMSMGLAAVPWSCKKQATVATSLAEAEYISAWEAACEIVWLRRILQDLGISQEEAMSLFIDNQSAIKLSKNLVFHSKRKHVDTKYHHIRSLISKDVLKPIYCPLEDQISDIFTKPLGIIKFTKLRDELGICCNVSLDHTGEC